jgi:murein DD-endopeptidase MepM/ murein hydrolase activator NlpD
VSSRSAKHRKSKRGAARRSAAARHRKRSPIVNAVQNHPGKTAAAVTGAVLIAAAAPAASHWAGDVGLGQAAVLNHAGAGGSPSASAGTSSASSPASRARHRGKHHQDAHHKQAHRQDAHHKAPAAGYDNPFRAISGLIPERIDQGVDFGGAGPVYALGDAVITNATATSSGWPDGGWITYRLTKGPAAGLTVFVAEDVTPTVSVGQHVTSDTVIAKMYNGAAGIETGWATSDGSTTESQLSEAGGISGYGPFPTEIGMNFEELLQALGVPAGNNRNDAPSGLLPSGYPADWPTALKSYRP